jgi:hypothetical protein
MRDYVAWHDDYDTPGSRLHLRLLVVQDLIARALDEMEPGPRRLISMCAGQGRDVITVASRHRRGRDLTGRLVELDEVNVATARTAVEALGLTGLEVVQGDAGLSDVYAGATPADLVVACGIFGNIADADIERTITFLPALCAPRAWVVWTRHPMPDGIIERIEGWFTAAGFSNEARVVPERPDFGVGLARLAGPPQPFRRAERLFQFVH